MLTRSWVLLLGSAGLAVLLLGQEGVAQTRLRNVQGLARGAPPSRASVATNVTQVSPFTHRWFNPGGFGAHHHHHGFGRFHRFSGPGTGVVPHHHHFGGHFGQFNRFNRSPRFDRLDRFGRDFPAGFDPAVLQAGFQDPFLSNAILNSSLLNSGLDPTVLNQLALVSGQVDLLSGLADFNSSITQGDFRSMIGGAAQGNAMANQVHAAGMYNLMTGLGHSARTEALSNVVRSAGSYNRDTAQSMIYQEQARSAQIDNQQKAAQAYYSVKRMHDEYEQARAEREKIPLETHAAVARANVPRPLSPGQLDPVSGRITWPEPLLEPEYALYRQQLEQLFELRAATAGSSSTTRPIRQWTEAMQQELRKHVSEMPGNDYALARRFLESLAYAVRPNAS